MYAIVQPNYHAFPHNRPSFTVELFDDDGTRIGSRAVMKRNLPPFTAEEQAISMLGSFTADVEDVHRDGEGYRINNLRPF
ncbi:hypothetical protein [uncultured Microbacterium sp.]|uniref:hypothetical protein n=1 Tax=uncultured Microbacterium sp. TaxID=191216 RepID=UPI0028D2CEE6|nr:hypothetical protein [uncultured Microbacterium sp.]